MSNKYNVTRSQHETISKLRFAKALVLTVVTVVMFALWAWHGWWSLKVMYYQPYGLLINNLVYGPLTWFAHMGISYRLAKWLNLKLLDDSIEADYKKYL